MFYTFEIFDLIATVPRTSGRMAKGGRIEESVGKSWGGRGTAPEV
jgi:hypothetical protein